MSGPLVFADLDDTLFQTLRKLPGHDPAGLVPATLDTRGGPHSYCTPAQAALLRHLAHSAATLIPVTGRDAAAFERVRLPFFTPFRSWRVLDHGLSILNPAGEPDPEWTERVSAELSGLQAELEALHRQLLPHTERLGLRLTRHAAHGWPFMSVLKHPEFAPEPLAEGQALWEGWLEEGSGFQVIANANNVSLLPARLGKGEAVGYLRQRHFPHAPLVLGLGDSLSDVAFLNACDFAVTLPGGQLLRSLTAARLRQR